MKSKQGSLIYARNYPRINVEIPVNFRILLSEKELEGLSQTIENLSAGGLMFASPVPLTIGTRLEMKFKGSTGQIIFTAQVTWTEPVFENQTSKFKCGLMFTEISDENMVQIYQILNNTPGHHGQ